MDLTLKQIIERTDSIHRQVGTLNGSVNYIQMKNCLLDLSNMMRAVNSVE
jgi:homoserine dehydrogenase